MAPEPIDFFRTGFIYNNERLFALKHKHSIAEKPVPVSVFWHNREGAGQGDTITCASYTFMV